MRLFSENLSKTLVWIGISLFFIGIVLFLWKDADLNYSQKIDSEKFSQFSDFVSGLVGSLWALAGVILFYVALTDQRQDIKTNREVLLTQVNALEQQIKEFELQREEMEMTREVFIEQSKTLKIQQFESTFFNSLNLLNNIIQNINYNYDPLTHPMLDGFSRDTQKIYFGKDSFEYFYKAFKNKYLSGRANYVRKEMNLRFERDTHYDIPFEDDFKIVNKCYDDFFEKHQSDLGHYFRTIYNIIKFVLEKNPENPKYYTNIVRSQLSTYEHLLLFYNCNSDYGTKFKPLIQKFSLLDNMPIKGLLDEKHKGFYPEIAYE